MNPRTFFQPNSFPLRLIIDLYFYRRYISSKTQSPFNKKWFTSNKHITTHLIIPRSIIKHVFDTKAPRPSRAQSSPICTNQKGRRSEFADISLVHCIHDIQSYMLATCRSGRRLYLFWCCRRRTRNGRPARVYVR